MFICSNDDLNTLDLNQKAQKRSSNDLYSTFSLPNMLVIIYSIFFFSGPGSSLGIYIAFICCTVERFEHRIVFNRF